jgi:hypothetical protein
MDRSLGQEFYLGAPNLPNSPGAKLNYLDIINYYNNYLQELISYLKKHKTELFIAPSATDEIVCRSLRIKCRILSSSRIENLWLWSDSHKFKPPNIKRDYLKIKKKGKGDKTVLSQSYFHDQLWRKKMKVLPEIRIIKRVYELLKRQAYYFLKPTDKRYFFFSFLKYIFNEYYYYRKFTSKNNPLLKDIRYKFVYFPLSTEPEYAIHVASQECFDQVNVIASVSRDLPANIFLVVKENVYTLGTRSNEFFKKIRKFKNVIFININENSLDIIKKSCAVVTISGSAGLEAAIQGVPVINYGKNNFYDFLPHVHNVSTGEMIYKQILRIFQNSNRTEAIKNGNYLKEALIKNSFDMDLFTNMNRNKFNQRNIEIALNSLENNK